MQAIPSLRGSREGDGKCPESLGVLRSIGPQTAWGKDGVDRGLGRGVEYGGQSVDANAGLVVGRGLQGYSKPHLHLKVWS